MKRLRTIWLAAVLAALTVAAPFAVAGKKWEGVSAEQVQAAVAEAESARSALETEAAAADLNREYRQRVGSELKKADRELEKAARRLEDGDLGKAMRDTEKAWKFIDKAGKRLAEAGGEQ